MEQVAEFGWLQRVPDDERQPLRKAWSHCVETGEDWDYEYSILGADGVLYSVLSIGRPVRDEKGDILYWAGFHLDNTERKRVEEDLQELNRTLEQKIAERTKALQQHMSQLRRLTLELTRTEQRERQRLAKVLHNDLQQQLVAAGLRVDRLESKVNDESLQDILKETRELLSGASSTARNLATDLRPPMLDDAHFIEGLRWLVDWIWQRFDLAVHLEVLDSFNPKVIQAELSAYLFETVRELLFNVVKHAEVKNARLRLGFNEKEGLHLSVIDQGVGSDGDAFSGSEAHGMGSGLGTIKERLQLMGGALEIKTGKGKGFQVDIRLPLESETTLVYQKGIPRERGGAKENKRAAAAPRGNTEVIRLMLVDDHRIVRDGLRMILQEENDMEVVAEAANGREALTLAREVRPDVIIMDINMPEMNGIDATRSITMEMPDICVIGLSIHDDKASISAIRDAGAMGYHVKSGPSEQLCRTIRSCFGRM